MEKQKNYGFWNLLPFIVGSVVGIGSYFKIGKILQSTGGSATIAITTWLIAIFIIFCTLLLIVDFSSTKDNEKVSGGLVHIIEKYSGIGVAKFINIIILYFFVPIVLLIEALVASQFLFSQILGINSDVLLIISTVVILAIFMITNGKSVVFGKVFQSGSLIIKLIPLTLLIIMGLIFKPLFDQSHFTLIKSFKYTNPNVSYYTGIISAMPAALFALDGWQMSTSVITETKGGTKTFTKAAIYSMALIASIYVLYTLGGLAVIEGKTWSSGDHGKALSIAAAFSKLFNSETIGKIISLFIVVAALGGLNGYTVFYNRVIVSSANRNWLPSKFSEVNEDGLSINASWFGLSWGIVLWAIICTLGYVFPTSFGTTSGKNFDVTASLSIISDLGVTGLYSIVYLIFGLIALRHKKETDLEEKSFRLPSMLYYFFAFVMILGAIFGIWVNYEESHVIYIAILIIIAFIYALSPKGEVEHNENN